MPPQQQPQQQQRTAEIKSRGFRSDIRSSSCISPLPIDGCKWGLTVLQAAKSKSGTFLLLLLGECNGIKS